MYLDLGHCWPGISVSGTAARWSRRGGGAAWLHRHSAQGTADRRLGRDPGSVQAASRPAEAIVLTRNQAPSPRGPRLRGWRSDFLDRNEGAYDLSVRLDRPAYRSSPACISAVHARRRNEAPTGDARLSGPEAAPAVAVLGLGTGGLLTVVRGGHCWGQRCPAPPASGAGSRNSA